MKEILKRGATSNILRVFLPDSTSTSGAGKTGLTNSSSGLIISTIADVEATATTYTSAASNVETITTLGTFAAPSSGKARFKEVDATNFPGIYEIQIADARFNVSNAQQLLVSIQCTGVAPTFAEVQLVTVDLYDSTRFGLTALPNAAAEALGGLATLSANQSSGGTIPANMVAISGDVTAADNLEAATDGTGYNVGGGSIIAASVTGAVGSVTGNVGGNVAGSVNSVITGVSLAANSVNTTSIQNGAITAVKIQDGAITNLKLASGAISSSTFATDAITSTVIAADAITSAEIATSSINEIVDAVFGANVDTNSAGTAWGGNTFGKRLVRTTSAAAYEVQVTNNNHISASVHEMQAGTLTASAIAAGAIDANALAASASQEIADQVWDEVLSGHLTAGSTGAALNTAAAGGGGGGGSTTVRMGPFVIKAEGQGSDEPLDINKGATHAIECQLVDAEGTGVDITGATLTANVYNSAGSLVETVSGTISYAALGQVRWTIGTTTTNTAGTYTVTITRTTGASDTQIFGPLRVYVRDI
jgi:hypothetical protein